MPTIDGLENRASVNRGAGPAMTDRSLRRFPFPGRVSRGGFLLHPASDSNHRPGEVPPGHDDRPVEFKPELVCRTFAGDSGARPLAPSIVFWESPDIWVVAPDGTDSPIAGTINQVSVHIWNVGIAPAYGVQVELYWCNPTVGVCLALSTQIGATQYTMLAAGGHKVLTFDWTPTFVNDGHECLVVQVYDPATDNLVAPFNPVQDRHVAQHNVNNVRAAPGHPINLNFFAANLSSLMARSEIRIEPMTGPALQAFAQGRGHDFLPEARGGQAAITRVGIRRAQPTIDLAAHPAAAVFRESLEPLPQRLLRTLLEGARSAVPSTLSIDAESVVAMDRQSQPSERPESEEYVFEQQCGNGYAGAIRPGQEIDLTLTITPAESARGGLYHAFRVIEEAEGRITGGITYLVIIDPPEPRKESDAV